MSNETNNRRFFWFKLQHNFFRNARIKKLRKIAGGNTYALIYLELILLTVNHEGVFIYEGIEPTIEEEIALKLDEKVEDVKVLWQYLLANSMIEERADGDVLVIEAKGNIGSETYNNVYKKTKKLEKFQSDSNLIPIDIDKEKDIEIDRELDIDNEEETNKEIGNKENTDSDDIDDLDGDLPF